MCCKGIKNESQEVQIILLNLVTSFKKKLSRKDVIHGGHSEKKKAHSCVYVIMMHRRSPIILFSNDDKQK